MRIEEPFRLIYTFGNEHVPSHRHGRAVVQIFGDGRVLVDNVFRGAFTRSWEGVTERATIERILHHLEEAGFPATTRHEIVPGATLRVIIVQRGASEEHSLPLEWSAATKMNGYGAAFAILDGLIAELTEGAMPAVAAAETGLVRRADRPSRPAIGLDEAFELGFAPALVGIAWLAKDEAQRDQARTSAEAHRRSLELLLEKYGRPIPAAPAQAADFETWSQKVGVAAEEIVSGLAAESFALARAAGQARLALEEENHARALPASGLLKQSRHAPAREIAALALGPTPDLRTRLDTLVIALRQAIGA
jgi:hypothetical protein